MEKLKIIDRLDTKLLNLKSGDHFIIDMNLEGRRFYEVKLGYKHGKIKPIYGVSGFKKVVVVELKKLIAKAHHNAIKCDKFYKKLERKKAA